MIEKEFTNNDIINLIGRNDDYYRNSLSSLEEKAEKTETHLDRLNGSVTRIKEQQIYWKGFGMATGGIIVAIILPICGWLLVGQYSLNANLSALKSAFNIYSKQGH